MGKQTARMGALDRIVIGIVFVIFGGIILHAPLSVGFSTLFPEYEVLIKSWKELLMIIAAILAAIILTRERKWAVLKHPIILLIVAYAALHLLLIPFMYGGSYAVLGGLAIDLRYFLFFGLVFIVMRLYPSLRKAFIRTAIGGAIVVCGFAILQVSVLPVDFLKVIGYNSSTIQPYLTVDENPDYIRINSTLRGPNPLGAYAVIVLSGLAAYWFLERRSLRRPSVRLIGAVLGVGSSIALWWSYSRSALVAAVAATALVVIVSLREWLNKKVWIGLAVLAIGAGLTLYGLRDTSFVANVILHDNPTTGAEMTSNQGHAESLADGIDRMVHQPLGGGIGSTGAASQQGPEPLTIENQYLFIAHESGWVGLALFVGIFVQVMRVLWRRRSDWLALATFTSGIGLALIGLLLPVWVDDTVAIVWWALAAIVIGGSYERSIDKTPKRAA